TSPPGVFETNVQRHPRVRIKCRAMCPNCAGKFWWTNRTCIVLLSVVRCRWYRGPNSRKMSSARQQPSLSVAFRRSTSARGHAPLMAEEAFSRASRPSDRATTDNGQRTTDKMQILAAIPHYYAVPGATSPDGRWHGSVGQAAHARAEALSACITALHQLY